MIVGLLLIGRFHPGTGAEVLDWRPTRAPDVEAEDEANDLEQMIAARNERRRRKGLPERTLADIEAHVREGQAELAARAASYAAQRDAATLDDEVAEGLARKNARRARHGLPALTLDEYRNRLER